MAHDENKSAVQRPAHGDGHDAHEDHGIKRYVVIWLILLGFTWLTWFTGRQDFGSFNIVIAMAIASTKATLVVLFFMHLWERERDQSFRLRYFGFFAVLLMLGAFGDLVFRFKEALPPGMQR